MSQYSVAQARDNLPRLIDRALAGEEVVITRRGQPMVELRPPIPIEPLADSLRRLEAMSRHWPVTPGPSAVELIRAMRDEDEAGKGS